MFQEILVKVHENISTVRSVIKINENLRNLAAQQKSEDEKKLFTVLQEDIPKLREWRIYDHCAAVTRLYAIYERFVEDLIRDWLAILPKLYPTYSDLEERIRTTHQMGVGKLLLDLNKGRYEHLLIQEVVSGIFHGVHDEEKYELLADAFLIHEQNLRKEILEKLLADAGVSNTWSWIEKHRLIKYFLREVRGNENTAEDELNELISYRNNAAHGVVDNILNSNLLLELCDFIETLCETLSELMTFQVIERQKSIGQIKEIGTITEWFKNPKAAVAKISKPNLSVGESLFLVGEAYCQLAKIESIRINDKPINQVNLSSEEEVGLKFDVEAKKGLRLYQQII
ncbi:MAG: MAE_28990/MAE_18760 family HEPN-like nuclease [Nostocaceae cyanobacterium]|nr:MAE_28990/MAE_18760 family HEPN-like nuclease [Nostocaceae cyanobacterium]